MQEITISVIVPIYKVEEYLPECIESILQQTYKSLEIILVDDGSPDESGNICDAYAKKDNRIKVIHKENGGLVSARKAGCELATGQYVTFVDGDDKIALEMYEKMLSWAEEDTDIIICDCYRWEKEQISVINQNMDADLYVGEKLQKNLQEHALCYGEYFSFGLLPAVWNKLYRRELYVPIQMQVPEAIRLGEDAACTYPCIMGARKVIYRKEPLYYYRIRETSMTRTWKPGQAKEILTLVDWLKQNAKKFQDTNMEEQVLLYACSLLDDYVTGNIKRKLGWRNVKSEYQILGEHEITGKLVEYMTMKRTSSRSKRVIKFLNRSRIRDYFELWLFIKWEQGKNEKL